MEFLISVTDGCYLKGLYIQSETEEQNVKWSPEQVEAEGFVMTGRALR
jgi:DNA/RNA endonuclease YhcR with UshA esterase domain